MSDIYEKIVREYQQEIKNFCYSRLKNYQAAEDCTQEVFLALFRKIKLLNLSVNIRSWLYGAAEREIKAYRRKYPDTINIDEVPEQPDEESDLSRTNIMDELDEEDKIFIDEYYGGVDRDKLAKKYGISTAAVYVRVYRIKQKLKRALGNNHKSDD